jgi:hypothetical protein
MYGEANLVYFLSEISVGKLEYATNHMTCKRFTIHEFLIVTTRGFFFINCSLLFSLQLNFSCITKINSHKMEPNGIWELRIQAYWGGSFLEAFVLSASCFVSNTMDEKTSWETTSHTAVQKTTRFYRTRKLITVFTRVRHYFVTLSRTHFLLITGLYVNIYYYEERTYTCNACPFNGIIMRDINWHSV